jgi:hypothetical protein
MESSAHHEAKPGIAPRDRDDFFHAVRQQPDGGGQEAHVGAARGHFGFDCLIHTAQDASSHVGAESVALDMDYVVCASADGVLVDVAVKRLGAHCAYNIG